MVYKIVLGIVVVNRNGSPISLYYLKASRQCIGCLEYWHFGDERIALQLRPVGFRLREAAPPPFSFLLPEVPLLEFHWSVLGHWCASL